MYLDELLDTGKLHGHVRDGLVRRQAHPHLPYSIFNYTETCQFSKAWDDVTLKCRGLIVNDESKEVLARPFEKFFNYGEHPEAAFDLDAAVTAYDKLDGSLGIMYPTDDPVHPFAVATRGSFTSDQAQHATETLRRKYPGFRPPPGWTCLFEIIYPGNRIVVDYGDADDLFLLGAVSIGHGTTIGPGHVFWPGPRVRAFDEHRTLADVLAAEPRPNAEGIVVHFPETDTRVKVKQDDYVRLHRIITGMNARTVWELLGEGKSVSDICEPLPDEFHGWVKDVGGDLIVKAGAVEDKARAEHDRIIGELMSVPGWTRRDYAERAVKSESRQWLFMILDGRDPATAIWKTLKPAADTPMAGGAHD